MREALNVLFGQNLGGGHNSGLVAVTRRLKRCHGGDNGFARADVSLNKALHGRRARDVATDVGQHALLR